IRDRTVTGVQTCALPILIGGGADDGIRPDAGAPLAGVALGAGITVRAGDAVRLGRGGAGAVGGIADAGLVALIEGGADDGVGARDRKSTRLNSSHRTISY